MVKGFSLPIDYVLYEISYANMIMLGATLPSYNTDKKCDKDTSQQDIIRADDPCNRERVKHFLEMVD